MQEDFTKNYREWEREMIAKARRGVVEEAKKNKDKNTYNTIFHKVREDLEINVMDYCLVDTIDKISRGDKGIKIGRWCYSSHEYLGGCIGVSKKTIDRMLPGLIKKGLLEKEKDTRFLRATEKWTNKVNFYKGKIRRRGS